MSDPRYPVGRFAPPDSFTAAVRRELIDTIAAVPARLRAAVERLSADQLATPYREGGWSVAQVVHHLADSHMHAYLRCKFALSEDAPAIRAYSEAGWAQFADAGSADIASSLSILDGLHRRWAALLSSLAPGEFERTFVHPEHGPMALDRVLALYAWHGRHHVAHIVELRTRKGW